MNKLASSFDGTFPFIFDLKLFLNSVAIKEFFPTLRDFPVSMVSPEASLYGGFSNKTTVHLGLSIYCLIISLFTKSSLNAFAFTTKPEENTTLSSVGGII